MTRAALAFLLILAAIHVPIGAPGFRVTIYREIVTRAWFDSMPLAARWPVLDRPSPFTSYEE